MNAIDALVANLDQNRSYTPPGPIVASVDLLIAALAFIESGIVPGGLPLPIQPVNHAMSPYLVKSTDRILECDASGGVIIIDYPPALMTGVPVYIVKTDGTATQVQVTPDGVAVQAVLAQPAVGAQMQGCIVYSNGANLRAIT